MTCASCSSVGQDHACWHISSLETLLFLSSSSLLASFFTRLLASILHACRQTKSKVSVVSNIPAPPRLFSSKLFDSKREQWIDTIACEKVFTRVSFERAGSFIIKKKKKEEEYFIHVSFENQIKHCKQIDGSN